MIFALRFNPRAAADIEEIHDFLAAYSSAAADQTLDLIQQAISGLREFPRRYAVAPESEKASIELRHLIVGNYRVIYSILGNVVFVYRVVHATRRTLNPMDFL